MREHFANDMHKFAKVVYFISKLDYYEAAHNNRRKSSETENSNNDVKMRFIQNEENKSFHWNNNIPQNTNSENKILF